MDVCVRKSVASRQNVHADAVFFDSSTIVCDLLRLVYVCDEFFFVKGK